MTAGLVSRSVGPYTGVEYKEEKCFSDGVDRKFIIATYQAYNAFGLIGSECNGIVILDDDKKQVLCDEIAIQSTGWFGASTEQVELFNRLLGMTWEEFQEFVNSHPRSRYEI